MPPDEIEVVNLFGKLALDSTLQLNTEKVEEQTPILQAIATLLSAINNNTLKVNTEAIKGEVDIKTLPASFNPLTDSQLRASRLPVDVQFPTNPVLPQGAASESTLSALQTVSDNMHTVLTAINNLISAINTKIIKQDTDHIEGSVTLVGFDGLTDEQLRAAPIPVSIGSIPAPEGGATEITLGALSTKVDQVLTKLNNSLIKSDTDNVAISAGDLRILTAMRTLGRLSYDTGNNLRVTNSPTGTQTVSVTGTPNVAVTGIGVASVAGSSCVLSRLSFYKTLERFTFS